MDPEKLMTDVEYLAKLFKDAFPNKFIYDGEWNIKLEDDLYIKIENEDFRKILTQDLTPLIKDKKLVNKLAVISFKHRICCELQSLY